MKTITLPVVEVVVKFTVLERELRRALDLETLPKSDRRLTSLTEELLLGAIKGEDTNCMEVESFLVTCTPPSSSAQAETVQ